MWCRCARLDALTVASGNFNTSLPPPSSAAGRHMQHLWQRNRSSRSVRRCDGDSRPAAPECISVHGFCLHDDGVVRERPSEQQAQQRRRRRFATSCTQSSFPLTSALLLFYLLLQSTCRRGHITKPTPSPSCRLVEASSYQISMKNK